MDLDFFVSYIRNVKSTFKEVAIRINTIPMFNIAFSYLPTLTHFMRHLPRKKKSSQGIDISQMWYDQLSDNPNCSIPKFEIKFGQACPTVQTSITSFRSFDVVTPDIPQYLVKSAQGWLSKFFLSIKRASVSAHEDILIYMNKTTVPGFPFANLKKGYYLNHPAFKGYVEQLEFSLVQSPPPFIWKWTQKHEIRPREKLAAGKIRGFCVSPVDHCYLQSKYCIEFNEHFYDLSNRSYFPSAVGMSKYYRGFHNLYLYINRHPNIYYSDFSGFDSTISPQMMFQTFQFKTNYTDVSYDQLQVMWSLLCSNVNSPVWLENGQVVAKQGGNPSGQSNTIVDNTIINIVLFIAAYLKAIENSELPKVFGYFLDNVSFKAYGDDMIYSVSNEMLPFFNQSHHKSFCDEYGYCLKVNEKPVNCYEAEFLSHKVVNHHGILLPVPDEDKMLASLVIGSKVVNPLFVLMRALSLRVETWVSEKCRFYIDDFIKFCFRHEELLSGSYALDDNQVLTIDVIRNYYFTDDEIEALYTGFENVPTGVEYLNKFSQFKKIVGHFLPSSMPNLF